ESVYAGDPWVVADRLFEPSSNGTSMYVPRLSRVTTPRCCAFDSKLDTVFFVPPKIRTASSNEKIVLLSSWSAVRSEAVDRPRVFILFIT
ncbi:hypothetical protein ACC710_36750, partial [Rhizobium ruizarguesonis]